MDGLCGTQQDDPTAAHADGWNTMSFDPDFGAQLDELAVIPLFLLMGSFAGAAGLSSLSDQGYQNAYKSGLPFAAIFLTIYYI